MDRDTLLRRASYLARVRAFFSGRGFLEVETPILSPALIPESAIEVFETKFVSPYRKAKSLYLVPSPELWMKRLVAEGYGDVFQISKAFRNSESIGLLHNPEFTILEWYSTGADYRSSLETTEELFDHLLAADPDARGRGDALRPPFRRMTMEEAFREFAGFDLASCIEAEDISEKAAGLGMRTDPGDSWEAAFNRVFVDRVEPRLPRDRPLALMDYPARVNCLARRIPGTPWRERWELYVDGVETANCFTEETDPGEVDAYFEDEAARKREALVPHASDEGFRKICSAALPACSGVAVGVDRLLMGFLGRRRIDEVILFPFSAILE